MTEQRKNLIAVGTLLILMVALFSKILFTDLLVRAPDISSEFIWTVRHFQSMSFWELFRVQLHPTWDWLTNGGNSEGGGTISLQLLYYRSLLFWLLPLPASIAWFMVLHLFAGGVGVYYYCRLIGLGALAAFGGALVFALAPEQVSLINAGHVQKIATISFAPWAFLFLEKGFQSRRLFWFLATGLILTLQFFNMHWQIAYYTCLGLALYGLIRLAGELWAEKAGRLQLAGRLGVLNLAMVLFFLCAVAISLIPLADWSKETTRGVQSGANQGKGGLQVDEAMAWSLPPEEVATFIVPGLFGLSRQEGAYDTTAIRAYYWGRMVFTQTSDYMGLLPWLLLPLVLLARRDQYVWAAAALLVGGLLFSMGRYTPFYWWLYEYFPGVNHFRVPKMMLFVSSFGLAVLTGIGLQLLQRTDAAESGLFRCYLAWVWGIVLVIVSCLGLLLATGTAGVGILSPLILQPNRFAAGLELVQARWHNVVLEFGVASVFAVGYGLVIRALVRGRLSAWAASGVLLLLLVVDVSRINSKFMALQEMPNHVQSKPTPIMQYLKGKIEGYRVLVLDGTDPMQYVMQEIPVMYTSNPVQMQRWQDYLETFNLESAMPDIMNVKYLVYSAALYERDRARLAPRYLPVFKNPDTQQLLLENRQVLPKAWLVNQVEVVEQAEQRIEQLRKPDFNPVRKALVEGQPPITLQQDSRSPGQLSMERFQPNELVFKVQVASNCLLVLGEKYHKGWRATIDGRSVPIERVNHILRGVYLTPGSHTVVFRFDPLPFKVGKWLTFGSCLLFAVVALREVLRKRKSNHAP